MTRLTLDNFSADIGNTHKENFNYENKTFKPFPESRPTIHAENHSSTYQSKPATFKLNTLSNASGVSSIKTQMMKYRKLKVDSAKLGNSGARNGAESGRDSNAYSNALLRFKNLKYGQGPNTFR